MALASFERYGLTFNLYFCQLKKRRVSTTYHHKVSSALRSSFLYFSAPFKAYENIKIFHVFVPFCIHSCCLLSLKYIILPVETELWFGSTENNASEKKINTRQCKKEVLMAGMWLPFRMSGKSLKEHHSSKGLIVISDVWM